MIKYKVKACLSTFYLNFWKWFWSASYHNWYVLKETISHDHWECILILFSLLFVHKELSYGDTSIVAVYQFHVQIKHNQVINSLLCHNFNALNLNHELLTSWKPITRTVSFKSTHTEDAFLSIQLKGFIFSNQNLKFLLIELEYGCFFLEI